MLLPTLLRLLLCTLLLALVPIGAHADVTFTDGTFDDLDWSITTSGLGSVTGSQVGSGNPGFARRAVNLPDVGESVFGWHLHDGFVYDPALDGAIEFVEFSIEFENQNTGHLLQLGFEQGGTLYRPTSGTVTTGAAGWASTGTATFLESDFPAGPDFSASGPPITFGFVTANSHDPAAGYIPNTVAYDNIEIFVPEPTLVVQLIAGAALLAVVHRRPRPDPRSQRPIRPRADRKDRPVDRRGGERPVPTHLESEPDLRVPNFGQGEIPYDQEDDRPRAEARDRRRPPGPRVATHR